MSAVFCHDVTAATDWFDEKSINEIYFITLHFVDVNYITEIVMNVILSHKTIKVEYICLLFINVVE